MNENGPVQPLHQGSSKNVFSNSQFVPVMADSGPVLIVHNMGHTTLKVHIYNGTDFLNIFAWDWRCVNVGDKEIFSYSGAPFRFDVYGNSSDELLPSPVIAVTHLDIGQNALVQSFEDGQITQRMLSPMDSPKETRIAPYECKTKATNCCPSALTDCCPYSTLELDMHEMWKLSEEEQIKLVKESFARLIRKYHPDHCPADASNQGRDCCKKRTAAIIEAFHALHNKEKKHDIDRMLKSRSFFSASYWSQMWADMWNSDHCWKGQVAASTLLIIGGAAIMVGSLGAATPAGVMLWGMASNALLAGGLATLKGNLCLEGRLSGRTAIEYASTAATGIALGGISGLACGVGQISIIGVGANGCLHTVHASFASWLASGVASGGPEGALACAARDWMRDYKKYKYLSASQGMKRVIYNFAIGGIIGAGLGAAFAGGCQAGLATEGLAEGLDIHSHVVDAIVHRCEEGSS
mmetsp:Transcript_18809/g.33793  ORF Transcript_18809/g.33793 Transcript_18809/m.33793 type:complete len:466 (+) Transcript_18809:85-1482(+)